MNIIQMSLSASCIIVVSIIIRAAALDKLPKRLFQLLWLVAVLRLLVPFSFPSKLSIYNLLDNTPVSTQVRPSPINTQKIYGPATLSSDFQPLKGMTHEASPFFIWCIGMALIAIYLIIINVKSRGRFSASLPVHNSYIDQYLETNCIRRKIQVRISDQITTPLAYGLIRPVILFPSSFDFTEQAKLHYILTHEFLHIRRFDLIKKIILQATICIHWFNPLVWVMYILANRDIELACDEGVLGKIGKKAYANYAMALITMQENKKGAACVNYFSRYAIKERITSIMKYKKASKIAVVTTLLLILGVTTVFASTGKTAAENGDSKKNNETDSNNYSKVMSSDTLVLNKIDDATGKTLISDDGGKTWLEEEEWKAQNPTPDIEWWTAEGYSKWLDQERKNLKDCIGDRVWNSTDGWYTITQKTVDETISMYEEILQEIKNGVKHSKTIAGDENVYASYDPKNIEYNSDISAIITDGNGDEKNFDGYENKADLERDVKDYLKEQIDDENLTQDEANKILSDLNYK